MPTPLRAPAAVRKGRPFRLTAFVPPEQDLHVAVAQFLDVALPRNAIEFPLDHSGKASAIVGARLKARGGRRGVPDHLILCPGTPAIFIELKRARGGVLSAEQIEMHGLIRAAGHHVFVARSIEEVRAGLLALGVPLSARISA